MGFAGYFLIVWDIIRFARSRGIPVGPGRGSAAGSLVAYALRITDLDPLVYTLLFERFLNPERVSLPDIDMDFCMDRRGEVINYVVDKYGIGPRGPDHYVRDTRAPKPLSETWGACWKCPMPKPTRSPSSSPTS